MRRRQFITLLGGAAAAWPLAARAQQPAMPVVGYLDNSAPQENTTLLAAFRRGLSETGYDEGRNVSIEVRFAQGDRAKLPGLAAELVKRRVSVIVAGSGVVVGLAAKAATSTIPIVFNSAGDPVKAGLVSSINRPDGNVTGVNSMGMELGGKRLGLLRELLPGATRFAALVDPSSPDADLLISEAQSAAATLGQRIEVLNAASASDIDSAFAILVRMRAEALLVNPSPLYQVRRAQLLTLAARYVVPAVYDRRYYTEAGGLMSYGTSVADLYRKTGIYTGRILNGEKPADLPIERATKFELVVNLQTANAIGLDVPQTLLAIADEVIE
jgi:putative ABC transport system substrate-binding protein